MNAIPMLAAGAAAFIMVSFIAVLLAGIVGGGYLAICHLVQALNRAHPPIVRSSLAESGQPVAPQQI
jgi:uncharacterized protein YneF (UPF0154 family)